MVHLPLISCRTHSHPLDWTPSSMRWRDTLSLATMIMGRGAMASASFISALLLFVWLYSGPHMPLSVSSSSSFTSSSRVLRQAPKGRNKGSLHAHSACIIEYTASMDRSMPALFHSTAPSPSTCQATEQPSFIFLS